MYKCFRFSIFLHYYSAFQNLKLKWNLIILISQCCWMERMKPKMSLCVLTQYLIPGREKSEKKGTYRPRRRAAAARRACRWRTPTGCEPSSASSRSSSTSHLRVCYIYSLSFLLFFTAKISYISHVRAHQISSIDQKQKSVCGRNRLGRHHDHSQGLHEIIWQAKRGRFCCI